MPKATDPRPNILFILTDDQGCWAMGCAGNSELRTPNLDRLARTGTRFTSFFCASPVCSPARASILTGRIPSQHGVHDWIRSGNAPSDTTWGGTGLLIEYLKGYTGYPDILAADGYTCGISGKWHLGDSIHPQKGFTFWEVHAKGGGPYYNAPMVKDGKEYSEPRYVSDAITDGALRFLDERAASAAPFYLSVHYTAPHSPWDRENHPRDLYDDYHRDCPFDSIPRDPMHPWQINSAPYGFDEKSRRDILSGYFAAVTAMDANVGRILDRLEAAGLRERTLVIFMSDNGMNMGHHGIYGKGNGTFPLNMYDTSVKVPMVVSRPGSVPEGTTADALLSQYDLMPTLLEYVAMANPEADELPGTSFAALLRGKSLGGRESVVVFDEYGPVRMIRTREWKYVHRYPYGPHELYDLASDPGEKANLVDRAEHQTTIVDVKAQLDEWFHRYVDPAADGVREGVTGKGQNGLAGLRGKGERAFGDDWHYLKDRAESTGPGIKG